MSVNTYTPESTKIIHEASVDFMDRTSIGDIVHLMQYDNSLPIIAVKLFSKGSPYSIPNDMDVNVRVRKADNTVIYNPVLGCNEDRNVVYVEATLQMCTIEGDAFGIIELINGEVVAGSGRFNILVDENPVNYDNITSSSEGKSIQKFINESKSWAVGGTGTRVGEDTNNSKYYAERSASYVSYASDNAKSAKNSADKAKEYEESAAAHAQGVEEYAIEAKSWAIGDTGSRAGEDTDNAKYYAEHAGESAEVAISAAGEVRDLMEDHIPEVYIDWTTGELMYSGGALTLVTDNEGFLHWGRD